MSYKYVKFKAEVVTGHCPTCEQNGVLVSLASDNFNDLKQHINGKISYLPVLTSSDKLQSL